MTRAWHFKSRLTNETSVCDDEIRSSLIDISRDVDGALAISCRDLVKSELICAAMG